MDITVYCKELTDDLLPKIVKRLNEYDMLVEVHPDSVLTTHRGFFPFKFQFTNHPKEILNGKVLISGFELYIDDFDLAKAKEDLKPKLSFWDKLLGKKQPEEVAFASPDIEKRLEDCKKVVYLTTHMGDSFGYRFVSLVSAILVELTGGLCMDPDDEFWYDWYDNEDLVDEFYKDVGEYEKFLTEEEEEWVFHEFEGW